MENEELLTTNNSNLAEWNEPLPDYKITAVLKREKNGATLRAFSSRFNRETAVHLLLPDLINHHDAAERFFNEARQTARLRHAHLARGIDCGRAGKYFFYAMEFIRGETAAAKIERLHAHKLKESESLKLVGQAAAAMHSVYQQGLLITDLKANNWLIVEETGDLKITDFGVAKDLAFATAEQYISANAAWVAPEVVQGENPDIRSSLYSLGCVWYELLTGKSPFAADSAAESLVAQINYSPPLINEIDPKISPATGQLLAWLLQKDRQKRPRSAQQFSAKMATHPLLKILSPGNNLSANARDENTEIGNPVMEEKSFAD